jgi:small subunit ribosomal protein S27Ae
MAKKKEKTKAKKRPSKKWLLYKIGDTVERLRKPCPKCGDGVFMAKHGDRESCGKCGYTEFQKKEQS